MLCLSYNAILVIAGQGRAGQMHNNGGGGRGEHGSITSVGYRDAPILTSLSNRNKVI